MTLKGEGKGPLPPLLVQYVELRKRYPDYLVLFQVGDFYETFGEDAERLARAINITLTHKTSKDFVTPMAGIPVRSADTYLEKLLRQNICVAVADQLETPASADGLVKRDVTQLVTPGTVTDDKLLRPEATYLAAVATGEGYGLALLDLSTGEFRGTQVYSKAALYDELRRYRPAELLLAPELHAQEDFREGCCERFSVMVTRGRFDEREAEDTLRDHFGALPTGIGTGTDTSTVALVRAAGAVLSYALATQRGQLAQVTRFVRYDPSAYMQVGETALATLEVFRTAQPGTSTGDGGRTLLSILDTTRTAPGRRLLQAWLRHPLLDEGLIGARLDAVEAFVKDGVLRREVRKALFKMHDLERLASKLVTGRANARALCALARSLALVPELQRLLSGRPEGALLALSERLRGPEGVQERVGAALVENPPLKITEGGLIQSGFDAQLDALRAQAEDARAWIAALEADERAETGIPTLKIGFNGVFGYYLEVTRPYLERVPKSYRAVQTLKDRQRYVRDDLRERERAILRAEEAAKGREYGVFQILRGELSGAAEAVRELGAALAELDVYSALAEVAAEGRFCRPTFSDGALSIRAGRHPVVERFHPFIPNDLTLSPRERLLVLTGPNMSGKSTYLRQSALIALLAQIGSFVPAERAVLPLFDRIYTRIGASDDIAGGRSTFMVEMSELATILQNATPKSLVLLDEIGRGTSTFDGLALAWAAAEYLESRTGSYALFATHYFELTALEGRLAGVRNMHVAAKEEAGGLTFYHQVLPGPASKAYGLEVAKLAGVPAGVLERARTVLEGLEAKRQDHAGGVLEAILETDLSRLSPLEALKLLHELQDRARGLTPQPG